MGTVVTKLAFQDANTGEYYTDSVRNCQINFTNDLSKAKLYLERPEIEEFFDLVRENIDTNKRQLQLVKVLVHFEEMEPSDYLEQLERKKFNEYMKLKAQADAEIEAMSEAKFKRYKKLKILFKNHAPV